MLISSQTHECDLQRSFQHDNQAYTQQRSVFLQNHVASAENAPETDMLILQGGEPKFSAGFMTQRNQQWLSTQLSQ